MTNTAKEIARDSNTTAADYVSLAAILLKKN